MPRFSRWIADTVLRRTTVVDTDLVALVTDSPVGAAIEVGDLLDGRVQSDDVDHIVVMTQAAYNDPGFTPDPRTQYNLTA
jgi:hypothetical protein